MNIEIRKMTTLDAAAVSKLSHELGYEASAEQITSRLNRVIENDNHHILVATLDNQVVGWIHACTVERIQSAGYVEIGGIVVSASRRKMGIGKALIQQCEQWAMLNSFDRLRLRSSVHRDGAHEFYRMIGYSQSKASFAFEKSL